ncbi:MULTISPECIES: SEL1-like repeat protein [Pseudomonas]|uniref:SEL1-like repeat protein n=1 Tax=Pseudomonas TaxID=286 RepID=UPI002F2B8AB2
MRQIFLSCLLLVACDANSSFTPATKVPDVSSISEIKAKLNAFTCKHEMIPAPSAESDVLFQYARWLQKDNQLKPDGKVDAEVERLYRIAAAHDHYKANINLQNGGMRGRFRLDGGEYLYLSQRLIDAGVATGYYLIGVFLKQGAAGLAEDHETALGYFRKAADQGNAQAQAYLGEHLAPISVAPEAARKMRRCAAEQGHGKAAVALGVSLKRQGIYQEALEAFQLGVAAGEESAPGYLDKGFRGPLPDNQLHYLAQEEDLERAERYKKIWRILANYSYANPTVPEINDILPLPPAKLPPWDGKLQWLEARLANVAPPKPDEELIGELAKAKHLEPATGKPTPQSPAFIKNTASVPRCYSGQPCPKTGYWKASCIDKGHAWTQNDPRRFEKGEIMPTQQVTRYRQRFLLPDLKTVGEENVEWRILG